jgi:hypothetical protein
MRFRANKIGASLTVQPNTGGGTLVTCSFPKTLISDRTDAPYETVATSAQVQK